MAILGYAQAHAVDLIALETHGRSGLARWLVGGVADKVLRGATVPVLLHRSHSGNERPR
jgi:nucleotide-binding universal stress UspA family protein